MRHPILCVLVIFFCLPAFSQLANPNDAALSKARGLYDAPFTRQLVSFDCAVQFDWKKHFLETLGTIPPAPITTIDQLQTIEHRVFVDRTGAVVSQVPKATDLSRVPHATDLENAFQAVAASGINAWIPFATNVILPLKPTNFTFQSVDSGFEIVMSGTNVSATLMLLPDMRISKVVSELPQPLHFTTDFVSGPYGFLLKSVRTGSGTSNQDAWDAYFAYTYQGVQGIQLPGTVAVTQSATGEKWGYSLTDCKAATGITLKVEAPKRQR
ncbi:MAG TPA: hypothetical protein VG267_18855 [Terracidiphilus sp.]|jgi:hypothetical protein|nr:hypothetical protein [Terracidiphilus sp.]